MLVEGVQRGSGNFCCSCGEEELHLQQCFLFFLMFLFVTQLCWQIFLINFMFESILNADMFLLLSLQSSHIILTLISCLLIIRIIQRYSVLLRISIMMIASLLLSGTCYSCGCGKAVSYVCTLLLGGVKSPLLQSVDSDTLDLTK